MVQWTRWFKPEYRSYYTMGMLSLWYLYKTPNEKLEAGVKHIFGDVGSGFELLTADPLSALETLVNKPWAQALIIAVMCKFIARWAKRKSEAYAAAEAAKAEAAEAAAKKSKKVK